MSVLLASSAQRAFAGTGSSTPPSPSSKGTHTLSRALLVQCHTLMRTDDAGDARQQTTTSWPSQCQALCCGLPAYMAAPAGAVSGATDSHEEA